MHQSFTTDKCSVLCTVLIVDEDNTKTKTLLSAATQMCPDTASDSEQDGDKETLYASTQAFSHKVGRSVHNICNKVMALNRTVFTCRLIWFEIGPRQ